MQLFNMQPDASTANYNLDVLRDFRALRLQQSIAGNPKFVCTFLLPNNLVVYSEILPVTCSRCSFQPHTRLAGCLRLHLPFHVSNSRKQKSVMKAS